MNQNDPRVVMKIIPARNIAWSIVWAVGEELARKLAERDDTQCSYGNTIVAVDDNDDKASQ